MIRWSEKQSRFIRSGSSKLFYIGGYRSGKTLALVRRAIRLSEEEGGNIGLLGRFSYGEIRSVLVRPFEELCPRGLLVGGRVKRDVGGGWVAEFKNGSVVLFRNLKNPIKYESLELGWFGINQVNERGITKEMWEKLMSRLSLSKVKKRYAFAEGNFGGNCSKHGWVKEVIDKEKDVEVIYGSTFDNWDNLPLDYKSYIESLDPMRRKAFVEGSWDLEVSSDGARVYEEFDMVKHTCGVLPGGLSDIVYIGMDIPGNPAAVIGRLDVEGVLYIVSSVYYDGFCRTEEFCRMVADELSKIGCADVVVFVDAASLVGERTSGFSHMDVLMKYFHNCMPSGYRVLSDRLEVVKRALRENKLKVLLNNSNERLLSGFLGGYRFGITRYGDIHLEPVKDMFSHIHDALQYLVGGVSDVVFNEKVSEEEKNVYENVDLSFVRYRK
ncbi:MAG: hypothetical protein QW416_09325 [Candidatus Nitrosocaldaceae archaeon]